MEKPLECKRRNELAEITNLCPEWFQGKKKHDWDEIRFNCAAGVNNCMNPILTAGCNSVSLTLPIMLQTHGSPISDPSLFQSPIASSRSPRPTSHRFRSIDSTPPHQLLEESLNINYPGLVRELPGSHWSLIIFEPLTPSPPKKNTAFGGATCDSNDWRSCHRPCAHFLPQLWHDVKPEMESAPYKWPYN